jgi:nucleoside-diphosphate-sugar epimerase
VHIEDIARAALAVLEASRDQVHGEAFNVGRTEENYRVREVAAIVYDIVPACTVVVSDCARPEKRNYRVSCDKIAQVLPSFQTRWTVPSGVTQLYRAYLTHGLTEEDLTGRLQRICHIQDLTSRGMLDDTLRWSSAVAGTGT